MEAMNATTAIIKISAIHDITSPAIAKPRGARKMPTNENISPNSHNTQPKPGTQLKINPSKANTKPAVPNPLDRFISE